VNAEPVNMPRLVRRGTGHGTGKRVLGVGVTVAAALLTSACAAGQQAATANEQSTIEGTNGSVGLINVRDLIVEAPDGAQLSYPAGADAEVKLVLVNNGVRTDRLVSITSPAIADWGAFATTAAAAAVISAGASSATTAAPSSASAPPRTLAASAIGSASTSASSSTSSSASSSAPAPVPASASASSSASSSASAPLPAPSRSIPLPPNSRVSWGTPESKGSLVLLNFTHAVYPGTSIPLTLRFANAGSVTLTVPVALTGTPNTSPIPEPSTSSLEG